MAKIEKITKFEQQIEQSIDYQIEQLKDEDKKKSEALESLKSKIIQLIQAEDVPISYSKEQTGKHEKYSLDLRLTSDELRKILMNLQNDSGHAKLLQENGITSFEEFIKFIGLPKQSLKPQKPEAAGGQPKALISYAEFTEGIFGHNVKIEIPFGASEQMKVNYKQSLIQIQRREDLRPYISAETKFTAFGGTRLEFTIEKNGETIKYCASPEEVLRVIKDSDPEKKKEWMKLYRERKKIEKQIMEKVEKEKKSINEDGRNELSDVYAKTGLSEVIALIKQNPDILSTYQQLIEKHESLIRQEYPLIQAWTIRMLYDEKNKKHVKEKTNQFSDSNFYWAYLDEKKFVQHLVQYNRSNYKETEITYYPESKKAKKQIEFYKNGKIWRYFNFASDGITINRRITYDVEDKKYSVGRKDSIEFYDKKGEKSLHIVENPDDKKKRKILLFTEDGVEITTFSYMREKNPKMTKNEYLEYLAQHLKSPQDKHLFLELFMEYTSDNSFRKIIDKKKVKEGEERDYHQLAPQTVGREENGKMLGDCDDYAHLMREILKRQGITAFVLCIPEHAVCVWFEQRPNGLWDAYSMGTFGYDKNGNQWGMEQDREKAKGYKTLKEALNSLMEKYVTPGLGLEKSLEYEIKDIVKIIEVPERGKSTYTDIPVEFLKDPELVKLFILGEKYSSEKKYVQAIEVLKKILKEKKVDENHIYKEIAFCVGEIYKSKSTKIQIQEITKLIEKHPDRPEYHALIGRVFYKKRKRKKAELHFIRAVEKGSKDWRVYSKLTELYIDKRKYQEALKVLKLCKNRGVELYYWYYESLIIIHKKTGKIKEAIKVYETMPIKYRNNYLKQIHKKLLKELKSQKET
jgi:hypothetical protein